MSFHLDWNEVFRLAVIEGLKLIPEAGGLLSSITSALWKSSDNPLAAVASMMEQMLKEVIDEEALINLKNDNDGLRQDMKAIVDAVPTSSEHWEKLKFAIGESSTVRPQFVDNNQDTPWNTLKYLVPYATIRLTLLREEYLHYSEMYTQQDAAGHTVPADPKPPKKLAELRDEIAIFKGMVAKGRQQALDNRKKCLTHTWLQYDPFADVSYPTITDSFPPRYERMFYFDHEIHQDYQNRQWDIDIAFDGWLASFDQYLEPSRFWDDFDPETPHTPIPGFYYWQHRAGNNMHHITLEGEELPIDGVGMKKLQDWDYGTYFSDAKFYESYGDITQVRLVYIDGRGLTGIEVWYGGISAGFHGWEPSGAKSINTKLNVGPMHSYITTIGGRADPRMGRFWFRTNQMELANPKQTVDTGSSDLSDTFTYTVGYQNSEDESLPRLAYISGFANRSDAIGQLRFCWVEGNDDVRNAWQQNRMRPRRDWTPMKPPPGKPAPVHERPPKPPRQTPVRPPKPPHQSHQHSTQAHS